MSVRLTEEMCFIKMKVESQQKNFPLLGIVKVLSCWFIA